MLAIEDAQREEKRRAVVGVISTELKSSSEPDSQLPLSLPVQEKWLNKSTSLKSVREDVRAIIEEHKAQIRREKELEQARQDRAAAIENHVKALNKRYEGQFELPLSRFINDATRMTVALSDVLLRVELAFKDEARQRRAEEESTRERKDTQSAAPVMQSPSPGAGVKLPPQQSTPEASVSAAEAPDTIAMSIMIEFEERHGQMVNTCLKELRKYCTNFSARAR